MPKSRRPQEVRTGESNEHRIISVSGGMTRIESFVWSFETLCLVTGIGSEVSAKTQRQSRDFAGRLKVLVSFVNLSLFH